MANDGGKGTLTRIKNNDQIKDLIVDLLYIKSNIDSKDAEFLYSVALLLVDAYEQSKKNYLYIEYAYYIIAKTSLSINDFRALYDFAVNYGYYPIARKIMELGLIENPTINHVLSEISIDDFDDGYKVKTYEQSVVFKEILDDKENNVSFLAPTSYGKSELIFTHLAKNTDENHVAIIVPTKALIDQVFREAKKVIRDRKIIIHDQNFNSETDKRILAIVTQERALRLLDEGVRFDLLYIDEAHELLGFDFRRGIANRSLLLTRLIKLSRVKNLNIKEVYLSPVVDEADSLKIRGTNSVSLHKINKDLKIMDIHFVDKDRHLFHYDRYLGEFIENRNVESKLQYVLDKSLSKNLHFLYRPKFIEEYVELLYKFSPETTTIPIDIQNLMTELQDVVHPKFKLVNYLSKGIIYLHGRMPLVIRNYLLKFVRESNFIEHFVANSVVLAGMNLPIDNLFYISGFANIRDLHNLIGRVNRLNEIFSKDNTDLSRIFVPVHFIDIDKFPQNQNGSMRNKIEKLRGKFKDEVKNPLLAKYDENNDLANAEKANRILDSEEKIVETYSNPDFKTRLTLAGAQQILNYSEAGLRKLEKRILDYNNEISNAVILEEIKRLFIDDFDAYDFTPEYNAKRLENQKTISYYKMFINDLNTKSLHERIDKIFNFWQGMKDEEYMIYVGSQFGEVVYESENYLGENKVYVKLDDHIGDEDYLYNLAIIKLQTDEDYVGHEITLLLNTLLEFEIISQAQFDKLIYGTDSDDEIKILRLGISRGIYRKLLQHKMVRHIGFDDFGNAIADEVLRQYIEIQNGIERFELEQYFI